MISTRINTKKIDCVSQAAAWFGVSSCPFKNQFIKIVKNIISQLPITRKNMLKTSELMKYYALFQILVLLIISALDILLWKLWS